jgi:hypothetical protein
MHFANVVGFTCVKQDTLGTGGFTGVNMRDDTEIPVAL